MRYRIPKHILGWGDLELMRLAWLVLVLVSSLANAGALQVQGVRLWAAPDSTLTGCAISESPCSEGPADTKTSSRCAGP